MFFIDSDARFQVNLLFFVLPVNSYCLDSYTLPSSFDFPGSVHRSKNFSPEWQFQRLPVFISILCYSSATLWPYWYSRSTFMIYYRCNLLYWSHWSFSRTEDWAKSSNLPVLFLMLAIIWAPFLWAKIETQYAYWPFRAQNSPALAVSSARGSPLYLDPSSRQDY